MFINIVGGPRQISLEVEPDDTVDVLKSKLYEQLRRNNWITKNTSEEDLKLSY